MRPVVVDEDVGEAFEFEWVSISCGESTRMVIHIIHVDWSMVFARIEIRIQNRDCKASRRGIGMMLGCLLREFLRGKMDG